LDMLATAKDPHFPTILLAPLRPLGARIPQAPTDRCTAAISDLPRSAVGRLHRRVAGCDRGRRTSRTL